MKMERDITDCLTWKYQFSRFVQISKKDRGRDKYGCKEREREEGKVKRSWIEKQRRGKGSFDEMATNFRREEYVKIHQLH